MMWLGTWKAVKAGPSVYVERPDVPDIVEGHTSPRLPRSPDLDFEGENSCLNHCYFRVTVTCSQS